MHGITSGTFLAMTAIYSEKHFTHVNISNTRRFPFCCCAAWSWLRAPAKLSLKESAGVCSAIRTEHGAGRNSSISTNSIFQAFSTVYLATVGSPFSTRNLDGLVAAASCEPPIDGADINIGRSDASGFLIGSSVQVPPEDSGITGRPISWSCVTGGSTPSPEGASRSVGTLW